MKIRDETCLRGSFEIRVFKAGREVEHYRDENMIMAQARNALARLIGGDGSGKTVTKIGVGTNGDGPTPDDTGLRDAYAHAPRGPHAFSEKRTGETGRDAGVFFSGNAGGTYSRCG